MLLERLQTNQEMTNLIKDLMSKGENGVKLCEFITYVNILFVEHDGRMGCVKHREKIDPPKKPSENSVTVNLSDITSIPLDQVVKNGMNDYYAKEVVLKI